MALTGPSRVLVVRAGALGDVLLLRRAVTSLHAAGHDVDLLAPGAAGSVLAGPGRSEVERLWPWERACFRGIPWRWSEGSLPYTFSILGLRGGANEVSAYLCQVSCSFLSSG